MMKRFRLKLIFAVILIAFMLQSCAGQNPVSKKSVELNQPSVNQAQKYMKVGDYQRAINIYSSECRKQPQDSQLKQRYADSLNSLKTIADNAFVKEDFIKAGKIYYVLQKNYVKYKDLKMLAFDGVYLKTKLSQCKKSLSLQGFQEYRKGNLDTALWAWQGVLDIDPDNKDIKEAFRTAKLQQKNLQ